LPKAKAAPGPRPLRSSPSPNERFRHKRRGIRPEGIQFTSNLSAAGILLAAHFLPIHPQFERLLPRNPLYPQPYPSDSQIIHGMFLLI
jgi:hypothetical protein